MIRYILEFMLCSALFYALYRLLLEGRTAHRAARAYLVGSMLLAVVIPMLELPLYPADTIYYEVPIITLAEPYAVTEATDAVAMPQTVDWWQVLMAVVVAVYAIITALNLGRMAWRMVLIRRLRQRSQLTFYEAYTLAENDAVREPFSFWRTIFLSRVYTPREREQIIAHEASHIHHQHTVERLTLEALRCVAWFNPFVWVTATALIEVQEWEADQDVLHQGYDVYEYRQLIFRQLFGYNPDITCGLKSQTSKKRFLMMTTTKRDKLSLVRYGAVIPLVAVMILAFGAVRAEAVAEELAVEPTVEMPTPPDDEKSEVYISAEGKIFYNGEEMTFDELRSSLEKLRAAKGAGVILTIKADDKTAVGVIDDVKEVARAAQVLRIKYDVPLGGEMTVNVLPPKTTAEPNAKIQVMEYIADSNNLLTLFINARGLVLTTRPDGTQAVVDLAELKSIIKAFVDNSESVGGKRQVNNPNYADFTWQTIKRGDGEVHYPVSNGVISLVTVRDTPADKYMEIQEVIITAYAELREELSQSSFGKSFESLDIDERRFIMRAIPVKVSEVGQSSNTDAPKTL